MVLICIFAVNILYQGLIQLKISGKNTYKVFKKWYVFLFIISAAYSCNPTKYVPENKQLLDKSKIKIENNKIDNRELSGYIKQTPNKRILGARFHLWLYNRSRRNKDNGFNRWLKKIGEEPVIYDPYLTQKSSRQLQLYMYKKGYYHSKVDYDVSTKRKKTRVIYNIESNEPFIVNDTKYRIEDTSIRQIVLRDTVNTLVRREIIFDEDVFQMERARIERCMREYGYYKFSKEYIYYDVDSTIGNNRVDVLTGIKKNIEQDNGSIIETPHRTYELRHINIYADFPVQSILSEKDTMDIQYDNLYLDDMYFNYPKGRKKRIKAQTLGQSIFLSSGNNYRISDVEKTYKHLLSLKVFKYINIAFHEVEDSIDQYYLDCEIQLSQLKNQSYTLEIEGTNSSGNIGAAGNVIYQHKNLFNGAEMLNVKFTGAIEAIQESKITSEEQTNNNEEPTTFNNTLELGVEAGVIIPRFLLPIKTEGFIKKFNPQTSISSAYNYHRRPEYTRTIANATFGYTWKGNRFNTHTINPVEVDAVKIFDMSTSFYDSLPEPLKYSYEDHFIAVTNYSFVFTNQNIKKNTDFVFIRVDMESAGILFSLYNNTFSPDSGEYKIFGMQYAQYLKGDIDLRYSRALNETDRIVYRIFAGVGYPYGNSKALPFEKRYFSGGSNSIRAWQVRSLGPGSIKEENPSKYPNQTGDLKLEANVEYRFDLFWILEGALFLDMGNIWEIRLEEGRDDAHFKLDKFHRDIAVATGFGMRFDFSFFVFRFDLGIKLRDPILDKQLDPITNRPLYDTKWIPSNRSFDPKTDFGYNIGIGYPF